MTQNGVKVLLERNNVLTLIDLGVFANFQKI